MLPIGSLIRDGDDAGIIVGGFQGKTRTAYVYVDQDGEPNFQFSDGIKPAAGEGGGLPAVTDLQGRDPLAELRGAEAAYLAVDMQGRTIGTKKKPRTGLKTTRKLGGGEGKSRAEAAAQ